MLVGHGPSKDRVRWLCWKLLLLWKIRWSTVQFLLRWRGNGELLTMMIE